MDFSFTCEIEKQPEWIPQVSQGCQNQLKSARLLYYFYFNLPGDKAFGKFVVLGKCLRVIINFLALSSKSRQLGGLPNRHQKSHCWRACSSPMNYASLICLCCFCTVMDIKEQDSSAPWSIIPLAMLLIVFSLTVLQSDIGNGAISLIQFN